MQYVTTVTLLKSVEYSDRNHKERLFSDLASWPSGLLFVIYSSL